MIQFLLAHPVYTIPAAMTVNLQSWCMYLNYSVNQKMRPTHIFALSFKRFDISDIQGLIQEFALGGRLLSSPPLTTLPLPHLSSPPLWFPIELGPLKPARGLGSDVNSLRCPGPEKNLLHSIAVRKPLVTNILSVLKCRQLHNLPGSNPVCLVSTSWYRWIGYFSSALVCR